MAIKHQITICLGSSCFARGSKKVLDEVKRYLSDRNLDEMVDLRGSHCMQNCLQGPSLRVDGILVTDISVENIQLKLDEFFNGRR